MTDTEILQFILDNHERDDYGAWLPEWCFYEWDGTGKEPTLESLREDMKYRAITKQKAQP